MASGSATERTNIVREIINIARERSKIVSEGKQMVNARGNKHSKMKGEK